VCEVLIERFFGMLDKWTKHTYNRFLLRERIVENNRAQNNKAQGKVVKK